MENSFFEYRDKTGVESDSDTEIIDNSLVSDESFTAVKKTPGKNRTVFVAESEESHSDGDSEEELSNTRKLHIKQSSLSGTHLLVSSDDDAGKRGNINHHSQLEKSLNNVVLSSSSDDEEIQEASPEILPKRRPPLRVKSNELSDASITGRKKNKRLMLLESESDNSIIIEHNKNKKMQCLKSTPLKVDDNKMAIRKKLNESAMDQSIEEDSTNEEQGSEQSEEDESDDIGYKAKSRIKNRNVFIDSDDDTDQNHGSNEKGIENDDTKHLSDEEINYDKQNGGTKKTSYQKSVESDYETGKSDQSNHGSDQSDQEDQITDDEDDGPDEDEMVMSRATRMSIMGFVPKGTDDSDDSDFIQSDETPSRSSDLDSLNDLPDVTIAKDIPKTPIATQTEPAQNITFKDKTPQKQTDSDTSRLSCSPFSSPLNDITNDNNYIEDSYDSRKTPLSTAQKENNNASSIKKQSDLKTRVLNSLLAQKSLKVTDDVDVQVVSIKDVGRLNGSETVVDEDVTIVESAPEVIALSSDDDDDIQEIKPQTKSRAIKKSPSSNTSAQARKNSSTIKEYFGPPSYPNNQVVYVKKHVRQNELAKLEGLKEDLSNIKNLLENMDMESLPDGGVKLIERLTQLERTVREQGDKVANMVVEPDIPSPEDIANDGFGAAHSGVSWEDLQKGSQAVQPRQFGKQAMATHMASRNLILERLRDLHESLASRPPDSQLARPPPALTTTLMQHQLHALAWLTWRETQSPCGGILADDMGLGKTITMIALIVSDKDGKLDEDDDDEEARGHSKLARGGTLVVCPASLMSQWSAEVSKHCSAHALSVCLHHGASRAEHPHRLATNDMVLTTYNILQRDNEKKGVLMKVLWRRVILDEAHIVRNHKSATSTAVSALKGKRRWCLTGTPVQNKDLDLFALLKFLRCTPFDDFTMWKRWIDNKSQGGHERLSAIMRCILLRRTKQQLQKKGQLNCLPEREAHLKEVTLAKEEMNVYQKVLVFSKTLFAQFLHQRAEKQADATGALPPGKDSEYAKMHKRMIALQGAKPVKSHEILVLLLRLRQVCCHCGLIAAMLDEDTAGETLHEDEGGQDLLAELNKLSLEDKRKSKNGKDNEEEEPEQEGTTAAEAIRSVLSPNNPVFELSRQSSKIKAVMECLQDNVFANKGHKAVVVSQWTSVLRLVEKELERARIKSVTLSGSVAVPARAPLIQKLNDPNSNVRVMLLSLCAGGVGLNLCGANHLLLLDPHWNPQLEEQAQDRIYRVGQTRPVHIYRFMCVDTVEQSIRKLQLAKLELAEDVLTGAKNTNASKLTIEDLKTLFNMGPS